MEEYKIANKLIKIAENKNLSEEELASKFFAFLKKHNSTSLIPKIKIILENTHKKELEKEIISIRSRYKMDKEEIEEIKKLVSKNKNTEVKEIIDKAIIGGFIAEYKGVVYDGSLANQIKKLSKSFEKMKV